MTLIDLERIGGGELRREPFCWAAVDRLFEPTAARALAMAFPADHFKTVKGYDGEKGYEYEARSFIHMGAAAVSHAEHLTPVWRRLGEDLLSPAYRAAITRLGGVDVTGLEMEANVCHYGPNAFLGPHVDLADKLLTHVFYFNDVWPPEDGGCLTILRSSRMEDADASVQPLIGNSAVLVRSDQSWHAVSRVRDGCRTSRRSLVLTFYKPGAVSTMWPPGDRTPLRDYPSSRLARWVRRG